MPLDIKFVKLAESQDNKTVTFKDNTGAYDAETNPGGYGTPNPEYTDVLGIVIQITNLKTSGVAYYVMGAGEAQAFVQPGSEVILSFDSYRFGQTAFGEDIEAINDGTYQIRYVPLLMKESEVINVTKGSVVATGSGFTTTYANSPVVYFDGNLYEIDKINGFTDESMRLKTACLSDTGSYLCSTGPMLVLKFGLIGVSNAILIKSIGQITCAKDTEELMDVLLLKFGADAKDECGEDMVGYQKIVDGLNSYFNNTAPC